MNNIDGVLSDAENLKNSLDKSAYDYTSSNIDTSWEGLSGYDSDSSSSQPNPKDYDLIERAIDNIEHKISNLKNTADDTFSTWSERNSAPADEIGAVADEINLQEQAYNKYIELANSTGLSDYYKDLIMNGDIDVITVEDEGLQEQIDKFINSISSLQCLHKSQVYIVAFCRLFVDLK